MGIREIVDDVGVCEVEQVPGVEAVTLLGHGQRDDARVAGCQAREGRLVIRGADQQLADRADDTGTWRRPQFDQRV
jgi:hypothetical protein